jgi:hypothetical protein
MEVAGKINYYVQLVDFTKENPFIRFIRGDFIDLLDTDQDLTKILISLNGGDWLRLSDVLPVTSPFLQLSVYNQAGNIGYIKLLIGQELLRTSKQAVTIYSDKVGLFRTADWNKSLDAYLYLKTSTRPYAERKDETVASGEYFFCASGDEWAYATLTINGEYRVDGKLIAKQIIINGKLVNNNIVEVD